ncbi:hypothetical protein [Geoalkalibacter subterraneus]|nr:hypothetical protein [Geoalkalibacter subterraneus]
MTQPAPHPLDALSECICKSAFLADALSCFAAHSRDNLSPRGLEGLSMLLADIERNITHAKNTLEEKEATA